MEDFVMNMQAMEAVRKKIDHTYVRYLKYQKAGWQKGMKNALERLRGIQIPKMQFAEYSQAGFKDQNQAFDRWVWQLKDALDEADDVLDDFEYKQITKVRSVKKRLVEKVKRALKIDPNLKRLVEVVRRLEKFSAEVSTFLPLLERTKQEQQEQLLELYGTRETGSLPKNDLIGRGKDKEFVMEWLMKEPSNEERQKHITGTTSFKNISLLSIVGLGGIGKTTLLQRVYEDKMTKEFDLKMWVSVSYNFDVKEVIAEMLECLTMKKTRLDSLDALQMSLKSVLQSRKFLLVLDDIWEEEEERDIRKWEDVLAPLAFGSLGSKILVTTRMDSVASTIAKAIKKKKEILRLKGLKMDECFQLLMNYAFADVENPEDHKRLRFHCSKDG